MLIVTPRAKEKFKEALLQEQTTDSEVAFRITPIPSMPERLGIALDKGRKGDQLLESEDGIKLLLIRSDLAQELEGMVLDHQESFQVAGFTISKLTLHLSKSQGGRDLWKEIK